MAFCRALDACGDQEMNSRNAVPVRLEKPELASTLSKTRKLEHGLLQSRQLEWLRLAENGSRTAQFQGNEAPSLLCINI